MSEAQAVLIGALAGALTALLAAAVAGFFTLRTERIRQEKASREAHIQRLQLEARELFRAMFAIQHAIQNLCWYATYSPTRLGDLIPDYKATTDKAWAEALGALVTAASLSKDFYERIDPFMDKLGNFEGEVVQAIEDDINIVSLQGYYMPAISIYKRWPSELASVLNSTLTKE